VEQRLLPRNHTLLHRRFVNPEDPGFRQDAAVRIDSLAEAKKVHYEVIQMIVELHDRMQAGHLSCVMTVRISKPLTRAQGDALNARRTSLIQIASNVSGSAAGRVGSLGGPYVSSLSAYAVGKNVGRHMGNMLPTFHAGDVIVTLDAQVHGGIGPQRSTLSLVVKS
jgi:hypothetical protein